MTEPITQSSTTRHLAALGGPVGLSVGSGLAAFCASFEPHLRHFSELGLQLDPPALACVTLGNGAGFGAEVAAFMAEQGFDPAQSAAVARLQAAIDEWMLVRALQVPGGELELGLYFRKAMSLPWALAWLEDQGVGPAERAALEQLDRIVGSGRTGIVAARFVRGRPTLYKVYLHAGCSGDPQAARALGRVFSHFQLPRSLWERLVDGVGAMQSGTSELYLSLLLGDGDAFDSLKLDMFQVDLEILQELLGDAGLLSPGAGPVDLGRPLAVAAAEHFGLRFSRAGASLTIYFVPDDAR